MSNASSVRIAKHKFQEKSVITNGPKTSSSAPIAIKDEIRRCFARFANSSGKTNMATKQVKVRIFQARVLMSHWLSALSVVCWFMSIATECSTTRSLENSFFLYSTSVVTTL